MKEELSIRRKLELREHEELSPFASFSDESLGRDRKEESCDIRTVYQRDRDKILYCKAFRRLKHKTQVFLEPEGDHYQTRMTHTLEVSQNARTIARALRLNEDLAEAIALGHDLGHTPFGHSGERALNKACPYGFQHNMQSIRVVELLENHGQGLNLTKEVRDGIQNHKTVGNPMTLEGKIVRIADKIAYINHDINDAIRGNIIKEEEIPQEYRKILGNSSNERADTLIYDIVRNSENQKDILLSEEVKDAMDGLRRFLFEYVYTNPIAKGQEYKIENLIKELYGHYIKHLDWLPEEYLELIEKQGEPKEKVICDYIAGMTDRYAITTLKEMLIPKSWDVY